MAEFKLNIPDMTCEHCEKRIREAVGNAGGVVKSLDLNTKKAVIDIEADAGKVLEILDEAGYDAAVE